MTCLHTRSAVPAVFALLLLTTSACAQMSPDALRVLEESSSFTQTLKTYYADMVLTMTMGQQTVPMSVKIWAEQPDNMLMISQGAMATMAMYCNGTKMTMYYPSTKTYTTMEIPAQMKKQMGMAAAGPMGQLLAAGDALKQAGGSATLVGKESMVGVPCNHLRMSIQNMSIDLWMAEGNQPLPVCMSANMMGMQMQGAMRWICNQPIPAGTFQFTPPPGATQAKGGNPMGMGAMSGMGMPGMGGQPGAGGMSAGPGAMGGATGAPGMAGSTGTGMAPPLPGTTGSTGAAPTGMPPPLPGTTGSTGAAGAGTAPPLPGTSSGAGAPIGTPPILPGTK